MPNPDHPSPQAIESLPAHKRAIRDRRVYGGVAVACVAGLTAGLIMKPNENDAPPARRENGRVVEIPTEPGYSVSPITPAFLYAAARPAPAQPEPVVRASAPEPEPAARDEPAARLAVERRRPRAEPRPEPYAPPRAVRRTASARPSFDCGYARSLSEELVCSDPRLAAADRRLAQAFNRAVRAGVPPQVLRRQQDIWLEAREAAAHDHPAAVADVYEVRIAELRDMAFASY